MKSKIFTLNGIATLGMIVIMIALIAIMLTQKAGASSPVGLPTSIATTSVNAVSTTASTLFATSTCDARIITTKAQPIMLTFSDYAGQSPTAVLGHLQAASTTVVYDSGQYGCGRVRAYAFGADTVTVSESR